jgi:hypothetical protein
VQVDIPAARFDEWSGAVEGPDAISQTLSGVGRWDGTNSAVDRDPEERRHDRLMFVACGKQAANRCGANSRLQLAASQGAWLEAICRT